MSAPVRPPHIASGRRRRRRDDVRPLAAAAKGLGAIILLGAIVALALRAYNGVPFENYRTLYLTAPAVGNLHTHDAVRIAGVRVGQVIALGHTPDGRARVQLQLEPDAPPLPGDTQVAIRAAGLLGARYVQLIPGHSARTLAAGATIRVGADALTFGLPDALDTYDALTRGRLGDMIRGLGIGMVGRGGGLNDAIASASGAQQPLQLLSTSVLARPGAARRLIPSLDQMATAFAASAGDMSRMFSPMAASIRPFADQRQPTRSALDEAPSALSAASAGLDRGQLLLDATRALARAATLTLPDAPAGLRAATDLLLGSHLSLRRTAALLSTAEPAIPAALRITSALSPIIEPLRGAFDDLTPMSVYIGRYGCDIAHFAAVFRSMTGIGATPGGEVGPFGQFRFQLIPSPAEDLGSAKPGAARAGYASPCSYLRTPDFSIEGAGGS